MIKKYEVLSNVQKSGIVAVVRGSSADDAHKTSVACIKGGVKAIEVAFTAPHADKTIEKLSEEYADDDSVIIGAGTVLEPESARLALMAGAEFVVSPSFNQEVAKMCNLYGVSYIAGCFSPREAQLAMEYGVEVVKIFPAGLTGVMTISEFKGPFPQMEIMPSGGVSLDNLADWFKAGAFVVGVGGQLVGPAKTGDYAQVTENAKKFHEAFAKLNA